MTLERWPKLHQLPSDTSKSQSQRFPLGISLGDGQPSVSANMHEQTNQFNTHSLSEVPMQIERRLLNVLAPHRGGNVLADALDDLLRPVTSRPKWKATPRHGNHMADRCKKPGAWRIQEYHFRRPGRREEVGL